MLTIKKLRHIHSIHDIGRFEPESTRTFPVMSLATPLLSHNITPAYTIPCVIQLTNFRDTV